MLRRLLRYLLDLFSSDKVTLLTIRLRGTLEEVRECRDSGKSLFLLGQAVDVLQEIAGLVAPARYRERPFSEFLDTCGIDADEKLLLANALRLFRSRVDSLETGEPPSMHPAIDVIRVTATLNKIFQWLLEDHRAENGYLWKRGILRLCVFGIVGASLWAMFYTSYFVWKNLQKQGLRVTYYRGENFEHRMGFNTEFALFKDFRRDPPVWWMPKDHFSSRWEGWVLAPVSTDYAFFSQSDEGIRLRIDDKIVIDNWLGNTWENSGSHGNMFLDRGPHRIIVEHYDAVGPAALRIRWSGGPIPPNTVISAPFLSKVRIDPAKE